jgi:N6-L-threonylcarbamoyladenine synthase
MKVIGIETSCDDTCVAVVEDGWRILSSSVSSQESIHRRYGGVVPEIASRQHDACMVPVYEEALESAGITADDLDAVAVTAAPGLIGSLLVGVSFAKALAWSRDWALIGVSHLDGHLYSPFLGPDAPEARASGEFPRHVGLVASGGHTSLFLVESPTERQLLGATVDDAVGESFDKVAKFLGLSYPGGPVLESLAREWEGKLLDLPRPSVTGRPFSFSFSGLKTAVIQLVIREKERGTEMPIPQVAASFQEAIGDVLVKKTMAAAEDTGVDTVSFTGGVACNAFLRERLESAARDRGMSVLVPPRSLCTDNAAMIAGAGYHFLAKGERSRLNLTARANIPAPGG